MRRFAAAAAAASVAQSISGVLLYEVYLQARVHESMLSRVSAAETGLMSGMIPAGLVLSLPLARLVGIHAYLGGLAALIVLLVMIALVVTKGVPSAAPLTALPEAG